MTGLIQHEERFATATTEDASRLLHLSDRQLGAAIGVSRRTVQRYRHGESAPRQAQRERLESLNVMLHTLRQAFEGDEERLRSWLHTPAPALGGRTPHALLLQGEFDTIAETLAAALSGAHQ